MGLSIAWLAVHTSDTAALFSLAGVAPTVERDEYFETPISGAALNDGWYLLVGQGCDHRLVNHDLLHRISTRWPCIACSVEEHVMFSSAQEWSGGTQKWLVEHNAQKGMFDLTATGSTPSAFQTLKDKTVSEQTAEGGDSADVDLIFDVPLLLAKQITGFKHDEDPDCLAQPAPVAFRDLGAARGRRHSRWRFWRRPPSAA